MPFTRPIIEIVNVVASATIDQKLDLYDIQKKFPAVEYNPDQFPGAVFRLKTPKTSTLLFSTGKMVCTGSKSSELAVKAVNAVVVKLRKGGIKIKKKCSCNYTKYSIINKSWRGGFILNEQHEHYHEVCMNQNNFQASFTECLILKL